MTKDDLELICERLAAVFDVGVGPIPIERLVARERELFDRLRRRGLTWEQISRLLARAGVVRGDGRAFSAAHLRGIYARQSRRVAARRLNAIDGNATPCRRERDGQYPKRFDVHRTVLSPSRALAVLPTQHEEALHHPAERADERENLRKPSTDIRRGMSLRDALRRAADARRPS